VKHLKIYYVYFHDTDFVPIHVSEIINEMQRRGREVHVFTSIKDKSGKKNLSSGKIIFHNLWTIRARFISEFVFMVFLLPYLFVRSLTKKPDFFYTRHSAASFVVALIARLLGKPCLIEINDIVLDKLKFTQVSRLKMKWVQLYHYVNIRMAHCLLPVTKQIGLWLSHEYGIHEKKVVVIPNGVNVHRFSPKPFPEARKRYNIPLDSKVILSLGSLFPWAGIETLIASASKVLKKFPETLFVIGSGEEPFVSRLKEAVNRSGLKEKFLFFGFIPWDEASWFISTSDICVAPFVFKETRTGISSLRVFSYLSCARPVVGSDIPGLGDMLENEGMGVSFPMGDSKALAKTIIELLSDINKLRVMAERSRAYIIRNHSWQSIVDKIETASITFMAKETN
jgi:glycosyltransferase involved in cell wall biosynthesis